MNSFYYMLEQVWLAHKEAGLETLVQVQLGVLAVLAVAWVLGWAWAGVKAMAFRRKQHSRDRSARSFQTFVKHSLHANEPPA